MATPHVSGVAALVASRFANASTTDLKTALLDGADHPASLTGKVAGARRLNAYGAVTAPAPAPAPPTTTSPSTTPAPAPAASSPSPEPPATDATPTPTPESTPAPQPAPAPAAADTTPPIVTLEVSPRVRSKTLRRGLPAVVTCSEACRVDARLVLRSARSSSLGRTIRSLSSAGRVRITVRPSRTIARRWSRYVRAGARLRLELTIRDRVGNARKVVKTVRVTR